jgi:hypothetical protein
MSVYLLNAASLAKPGAVQLQNAELSELKCNCAFITETWFGEAASRHCNFHYRLQGLSARPQTREGWRFMRLRS